MIRIMRWLAFQGWRYRRHFGRNINNRFIYFIDSLPISLALFDLNYGDDWLSMAMGSVDYVNTANKLCDKVQITYFDDSTYISIST